MGGSIGSVDPSHHGHAVSLKQSLGERRQRCGQYLVVADAQRSLQYVVQDSGSQGEVITNRILFLCPNDHRVLAAVVVPLDIAGFRKANHTEFLAVTFILHICHVILSEWYQIGAVPVAW